MTTPNYIKAENSDIMMTRAHMKSQEQGVAVQYRNRFYHDFLTGFFSVFIMFIIAENRFARRLGRRMRPVMKIFMSRPVNSYNKSF